jgi:23S rRNA (cytosine1962-C5)-methyltransferase
LAEVRSEIREGLQVPDARIFLKTRHRREEGEQYERVDDRRVELVVREQGLQFRVNLSDYHDTGLFLDHRNTRAMVRELASGARLLNLFCYTGSFTVYAAAGGARSSTSVDLSRTYLEWAQHNLELNQIPTAPHRLLRADAVAWLEKARRDRERFDLIVCDPPTFSNSARMKGWFDVNAQHPGLIAACLDVLSPGGNLFFSTNSLGFKLLESELPPCRREEISHLTVPRDYRNRRIHRCWRITRE